MLTCLKKMAPQNHILSFFPSLKSHSLPIPLPIVAQVIWTQGQFLWFALLSTTRSREFKYIPVRGLLESLGKFLIKLLLPSNTFLPLFSIFPLGSCFSKSHHLPLCRRISINNLLRGGKEEEVLRTVLVAW